MTSSNEESPLLPIDAINDLPQGDVDSTSNNTEVPQGDTDSLKSSIRSTISRSTISPPTSVSNLHTGRILLLVVAFLYGSLSVSLRMVYARPGPPAASILSATRGWMTVLCLAPVILFSRCCRSNRALDPPSFSDRSFYFFCLELAVFNFGTQGLLNIGLLTTESARSAFLTQLSVVITPVLAATFGLCRRRRVVVKSKVWMACFVALFGLYVLSSNGDDSSSSSSSPEKGQGEALSWSSPSLAITGIMQSLSFGDWCCLGSAFCWSYYIYRLSDWGNRYDETQTMFVKNIFMAILYTTWTGVSYFLTTLKAAASASTEISVSDVVNATGVDADSNSNSDDGFYLWEGWRDPIALSILFYTALSSGAISDILQQKAQANVPAAESNVILSLEPVFATILGLGLLAEIPSIRECFGGFCIVLASVLASST